MGGWIQKLKQQYWVSFEEREPLTWVVLILTYGAWIILTLSMEQLPSLLVLLFGGSVVCLHGSLQHEAVHGHPSRREGLNTLLVALPLSLWIPYTRYRELHRIHHQADLTDPLHDPESYYFTEKQWSAQAWWQHYLLRFNQTLLGRLSIGPLITISRFWYTESRLIAGGDERVRQQWFAHFVGVGVVLYWISVICGASILSYILLFAYPGLALTLLRSYIEHRPGEDNWRRTAIVEGSWLTQLLFLNNNFHLVHHQHPELPWYRLKKVYERKRDYWLRLNGNFVYPSYWNIARRFGLVPKDNPVLIR
ncbi:MAG: fatty acid desaturase [Arenicellales bacterium]|nr:fatty acid desaturase [Arenicellales bacterium]